MKKIVFLVFAILTLGTTCSPTTISYNNSSSTENYSPPDNIGIPINPRTLMYQEANPNADLSEDQKVLAENFMVTTDPNSKEGPVAIMTTNFGDIKLQLFQKASPVTVRNFIQLAELNYYDGTMFHRVIEDFMIQGGDPNTRTQPNNWNMHGRGGPDYKFEDEFNNHKNIRGRLSMANSGPNTNGSQFFIVTTAATPHLDGIHTVFGEVIDGMDVVDKIEKVKVNGNSHPLEDVIVFNIKIEK